MAPIIDPEEVWGNPKDWLYDVLPLFLMWLVGFCFIVLVVYNMLKAVGMFN